MTTVPAFQSADAYGRFARTVTWSTRYVRDREMNEFLETLAREASKRMETLPERSFLWRAQLGHDWNAVREGDDVVAEVPGPFPPDRMKPLRDRALEGRANPKGITYLYLSTNRETACAEVRPWIGSFVSVGQFRILRSLRIVNCTEDSERKHYIHGTPPEYWDTAVWCDIDAAFSRPVTSTDDDASYVPTQIIAERLKVSGFDGLAYRSALGPGHNIALFDLDAAKLVNCSLYELKTLSFDFKEAANPYSIREDPHTKPSP